MNIDQFWDIVGRVNAAAPGDMDAKCALLADALRQLSREEVRSFASHFSDCYFLAYQWEIWDAAWLIKGRCSDDKFSDFRATLISLGRAPFEAALANADSLADFNLDPAWATYEGYQYAAGAVCEEKGGERVGDGRQHPREPAGSACPEWEMAAKFPKLAARHGHHDSDYLYLKEREEKRIRDEEQAGEVANLMLAAGIVHPSGLIPPFRIVAGVLRTGQSPALTQPPHTWKPFELVENIFWMAVSQLENSPNETLKPRPALPGIELKLDVGAPNANNIEEWTRTLIQRGLA